ncbi:MAG: XRE family transcriptional regulator [Planctomycetota bacterium]|jgi:SOS-response transcriptional repressor LexA
MTSSASTSTIAAGRLIREARRRAGLTQDALAARIGCSKAQLSLMEAGRRRVTAARARTIEHALGIHDRSIVAAADWEQTPEAVRTDASAGRALVERFRQAARHGESLDRLLASGELQRLIDDAAGNVGEPLPLERRIPVINKVAAGYPAHFTDLDYPASIADEYVACPDVADPQAFAARVVGDSMMPDYREGEIVVFSPERPTPSGSDCFVRLEDGAESTFKRVYFEDDGCTVRLQPLNADYPPRSVPREHIGGLYAAAYVMRRV